MQTSTVIILVCLIAVAVAAQYEHFPAADHVYESEHGSRTHDSSSRTKRSLILLKKKLLLGALGLKAVKVGAVGAAGVAGALALKGKVGQDHKPHRVVEVRSKQLQHHHAIPPSYVNVHDWSG